MDYREIRSLLEKYWQGETTLEEEDELKAFFNMQKDLPSDLQSTADLFCFFEVEGKVSTDDIPILAIPGNSQRSLTGKRKDRSKVVRLLLRYWDCAAVVLLLLASVLWLQTGTDHVPVTVKTQDTYQSPEKAFEATQKALQLVAANLNKSKEEMQKLALFHEAQEKVKGEEGIIKN